MKTVFRSGRGVLLGTWAFCVYPLVPTFFLADGQLEGSVAPLLVVALFGLSALAWCSLDGGLWKTAASCWLAGWTFSWLSAELVARQAV